MFSAAFPLFSHIFPRTFTVLCGLSIKHITAVRGHRGAFNGFLSTSLLGLESCVSLVMHHKSLDTEIKSTDQSETFSYTIRRCYLLTVSYSVCTVCLTPGVKFQGVISDFFSLTSDSWKYKAKEYFFFIAISASWRCIQPHTDTHMHARICVLLAKSLEVWPVPANNASLLCICEHICVCKRKCLMKCVQYRCA